MNATRGLSLSLVLISGLVLTACNTGTASSSSRALPTYCQINVANFNNLSAVNLQESPFDPTWGPSLANLPFPPALESCNSVITWQQQRVLAATNYWVSQKVNYCHHHVPTWDPAYRLESTELNPSAQQAYAACSINTDVMPPIPSESLIRWNYSATAPESAASWYSYDTLKGYGVGNYGYGLDCSDYSKLIYAYAESIYFTSDVSLQAGQLASESAVAPNMTGFTDPIIVDILGLPSAGNLVCADGTVAPPPGQANYQSCDNHGGYISVFNSNGNYVPGSITDAMLNNLQPGDLIYVAGCASNPNSLRESGCGYEPQQQVTHVVIWTGQQVGQSAWISDNMIAPETDTDTYGRAQGECGSSANPEWWSVANNLGNWIITDSHYQGPDYRAFTNCFYRNQVWGVRRIL